MNLSVQAMTEAYATESLRWTYEAPYDFYNVELTEESLSERMDGSYRTIFNEEGSFVGFFCTGASAKVPAGEKAGVYETDAVDMGLGMNPALTGQGHGSLFGKKVLSQIEQEQGGTPVRLSVATFNERAIRLYENMGFVEQDTFHTDACEFITMLKK